MIDIHTHLLPGVDDGVRSIERAIPVLEAFKAGGVKVVVCTPHLDASRARVAPFEEHALILADLIDRAPAGVTLLPGWEIMLDVPGADLTDERLGLAGSRAVLIEFPREGLPPNATSELFRIRMSGRVPVVAHPERYIGCTVETVEEWRRTGAVIQMDIAAVLRSRRIGAFSEALLEKGLIDIFASDTHGDSRSLVPARDWLIEMNATDQAALLLSVNAERILAGEPTLPVPPLRFKRGMLAQLREKMRRRG
jgi:protein-tyrosine phosphatase